MKHAILAGPVSVFLFLDPTLLAEPPDAGKEKKEGKEKEKEEEEEEEEGLVRSSEEEEEQGGGNTEDSLQEQSNMLGWGEDVIELAYGK